MAQQVTSLPVPAVVGTAMMGRARRSSAPDPAEIVAGRGESLGGVDDRAAAQRDDDPRPVPGLAEAPAATRELGEVRIGRDLVEDDRRRSGQSGKPLGERGEDRLAVGDQGIGPARDQGRQAGKAAGAEADLDRIAVAPHDVTSYTKER